MARYVPDVLSRRWVIISPQRINRPEDVSLTEENICSFCEGNEKMTPPEVYRIGEDNPNGPGWKVRVIPNKYPITDFHEVIIHSSDHRHDIEDLPVEHIGYILKAYRERFNFYRKKGQVLIFGNHGQHSGASLAHPHSQLVMIPFQINLDTLAREPINNLVLENRFFYVYCPDFSQWPYEVWIVPKKEKMVYGDILDEEIADLSYIIQEIIKKLHRIFDQKKLTADNNIGFGYNYYIYPQENWYFRIIPRFVHRAGFELGTGLSVNVIDPMVAAQELKEIVVE
jgi:UDPglucose--hexose-1-phosphate uridylyltransferase